MISNNLLKCHPKIKKCSCLHQVNGMKKMSTRPSDEFKNARKKFSLQKVKVTYRSEPTGHGTEEMSSIAQEQEYKSSVELKCTKNSDIHIYIYCMESFFSHEVEEHKVNALTIN